MLLFRNWFYSIVSFPIGIFDSGYGGLTVLKSIRRHFPQHNFLYFGDNVHAPYGTKTFDDIYRHTRECLAYLFAQGCPLVILACNTASARALRAIQQKDLVALQTQSHQRVLGVIRPTAEVIGGFTQSQHIGILGTPGTIKSDSYVIETHNFHPGVTVHQQACPKWVDFIEQGLHNSIAAKQQIQQDVEALLRQSPQIDCVLLACTHYPLVAHHVRDSLPHHITLLEQGDIVAQRTVDYLNRHPEIATHCGQDATIEFVTTGNVEDFQQHAQWFYGQRIRAKKVTLS